MSLSSESVSSVFTTSTITSGSDSDILKIQISIPELKIQKIFTFRSDDTVWVVKQSLLRNEAANLRDGLNYGLFSPAVSGRAGKFLDEERLLSEYSLPGGAVKQLLLKYKKRVFKALILNERKLKLANKKSRLKKFIASVGEGDVDKISKALQDGLDPNFKDSDSGETPLTVATTLKRPRTVMLTLVDGGAHLDYRNSVGMTAMHKAALLGNKEAIQALLDLGSSANYKDAKGLTPLYHCVCHNTDAHCVNMLLRDYAVVDITDEAGWTEVHQVCKAGRVQLLEQLLFYGASVNSQNNSGNTPLHICALNNQDECARVLLFRGANKHITNHTGQEAIQMAIMTDNHLMAATIAGFKTADVVPQKESPAYNTKRRVAITPSSPMTGAVRQMSKYSQSTPHLDQIGGRQDSPCLSEARRRLLNMAEFNASGKRSEYDSDSIRSSDSEASSLNVVPVKRFTSCDNLLSATNRQDSNMSVGNESVSTYGLQLLEKLDRSLDSYEGDKRAEVIYEQPEYPTLSEKKARILDANGTASIRSYPKRLTASMEQLNEMFDGQITTPSTFNQDGSRTDIRLSTAAPKVQMLNDGNRLEDKKVYSHVNVEVSRREETSTLQHVEDPGVYERQPIGGQYSKSNGVSAADGHLYATTLPLNNYAQQHHNEQQQQQQQKKLTPKSEYGRSTVGSMIKRYGSAEDLLDGRPRDRPSPTAGELRNGHGMSAEMNNAQLSPPAQYKNQQQLLTSGAPMRRYGSAENLLDNRNSRLIDSRGGAAALIALTPPKRSSAEVRPARDSSLAQPTSKNWQQAPGMQTHTAMNSATLPPKKVQIVSTSTTARPAPMSGNRSKDGQTTTLLSPPLPPPPFPLFSHADDVTSPLPPPPLTMLPQSTTDRRFDIPSSSPDETNFLTMAESTINRYLKSRSALSNSNGRNPHRESLDTAPISSDNSMAAGENIYEMLDESRLVAPSTPASKPPPPLMVAPPAAPLPPVFTTGSAQKTASASLSPPSPQPHAPPPPAVPVPPPTGVPLPPPPPPPPLPTQALTLQKIRTVEHSTTDGSSNEITLTRRTREPPKKPGMSDLAQVVAAKALQRQRRAQDYEETALKVRSPLSDVEAPTDSSSPFGQVRLRPTRPEDRRGTDGPFPPPPPVF